MKRFYVAALTGHSGTGKSYAARYLREKGVAVIEGDETARRAVQPGTRCLEELVRAFSPEILHGDGTLNRRLLADLCFRDPEKKRLLDSITHPPIIELMLRDFDVFKEQGARYCVVEAGALVESGLYAVCDRIILVVCEPEIRIARIMARDGISREQAEARIGAQIPEADVRAISDVVIENDGTLAEFDAKLDALAGRLDAWFEE